MGKIIYEFLLNIIVIIKIFYQIIFGLASKKFSDFEIVNKNRQQNNYN